MDLHRRLPALVMVAVFAALGSVPAAHGDAPQLRPDQREGLQDVHRLLETGSRAAGTSRPEVRVADWVGAPGQTFERAGGVYADGWLFVSPAILTSPHRHALIASAVAQHRGRHPSRARTADEFNQERRERLMASNAGAVAVLVEAAGLSERQALEAIYAWLLDQHRAATPGAPPAPGRAAPCDEIQDLLGRFPQHRAWSAALLCADGRPGAVPTTAPGSSAPSMLVVLTSFQAAPAAPPAAAAPAAAPPEPAPPTRPVWMGGPAVPVIPSTPIEVPQRLTPDPLAVPPPGGSYGLTPFYGGSSPRLPR
jgi:hypothetical protein